MSSDQPLTLQVDLTPRDLSRALTLHHKMPSTRSSLFWAAAITGVGLLTRSNDAPAWMWGGCFLLGAVLVLLTIAVPLSARVHWRRNRHVYRSSTVTIDAEGLSGVEEQGEARLRWTAFTRLRESPEYFMLYRSPAYFVLLPKRAFASSSDIQSFRDLARDRVPNG